MKKNEIDIEKSFLKKFIKIQKIWKSLMKKKIEYKEKIEFSNIEKIVHMEILNSKLYNWFY